MLEKLILWNFQKHKHIEIAFGDTLTAFVGKSNKGKSCALRGLRWICLNDAPKNAIRHGAKYVRGDLYIDGHHIIRVKGKSKKLPDEWGENGYVLDGKWLGAVGRDVPEEIATILNVSEVNFQAQLDSHFWFSKTAGQVSKELNEIVNLQAIDQSLANIATKLRQTRSKQELIEERLKQAKEQKEQLDWVVQADAALLQIEEQQESIAKDREACDFLRSLVESVQNYESAIQTLRKPLETLSSLVSDIESHLKQRAKLKTCQALLDRIDNAQQTMAAKDGIRSLSGIIEDAEKWQDRCKRIGELQAIANNVKEKEYQLDLMRTALQRVKSQIKKLAKGKCPVCNQEMK